MRATKKYMGTSTSEGFAAAISECLAINAGGAVHVVLVGDDP